MGQVFDLLIIDDDRDQVGIIKILLADLGLSHRCHHAASGATGLDFLRHKPPYENAPRPHLILLDLNMPQMDGCEVLRQVKSDLDLLSIPVIMLSTSQAL